MTVLSIGIIGITGRMGKCIASMTCKDSRFVLAGGVARRAGDDIGLLLGGNPLGVYVQSTFVPAFLHADILLDFAHPTCIEELLTYAELEKKPIVIGTTGHSPAQVKRIGCAAAKIPIFHTPNFSLGIAVICRIAPWFRIFVRTGYEAKIEETHRIGKKDAPSGTAIQLASYIADDLPIQSVRKQNAFGEHVLSLSSPDEKIEIRHVALSLDLFARGALHAAEFLTSCPPGLYGMEDLCRVYESEVGIRQNSESMNAGISKLDF